MSIKKHWSAEDVDKIEFDIPSPCSISWDDMKGDEKARLCKKCKHHVYNFSNMSSNEIAKVLNLNLEKVCIQLYKRKDGKVINIRDCGINRKNIKKAFIKGGILGIILFIGMVFLTLIFLAISSTPRTVGSKSFNTPPQK